MRARGIDENRRTTCAPEDDHPRAECTQMAKRLVQGHLLGAGDGALGAGDGALPFGQAVGEQSA